MSEVYTVASVACIVVTLVVAGYGIGFILTCIEHRRRVKELHKQRKQFTVSQHHSFPARRIQSARRAFAMARVFGRSFPVALCLAGRMLVTGSTGQYRIKV